MDHQWQCLHLSFTDSGSLQFWYLRIAVPEAIFEMSSAHAPSISICEWRALFTHPDSDDINTEDIVAELERLSNED